MILSIHYSLYTIYPASCFLFRNSCKPKNLAEHFLYELSLLLQLK